MKNGNQIWLIYYFSELHNAVQNNVAHIIMVYQRKKTELFWIWFVFFLSINGGYLSTANMVATPAENFDCTGALGRCIEFWFWTQLFKTHWFSERVRTKQGKMLTCLTWREIPGYASIISARNRSTPTATRVAILSALSGITGGSQRAWRHRSAKPWKSASASLACYVFAGLR